MENERKATDTNEKSLESRDYSKEYWYLNQLKWIINFELFTNPTLIEHNFYSNIARYIDMIQKTEWEEWETHITNFINKIKDFNDENDYERIKKIDIYLTEITLKRFQESNLWDCARFLENSLGNIKYLYKKDENGKIHWIFSWIINTAIPERYYWWLWESWLWDRILKDNKIAFARAIREQREKADELKDKL